MPLISPLSQTSSTLPIHAHCGCKVVLAPVVQGLMNLSSLLYPCTKIQA
jgi:hypothetical protein